MTLAARFIFAALALGAMPALALAGEESTHTTQHAVGMVADPRALLCLGIFILAYIAVITEEFHGLRKSKAVILAAGAIWIIIGVAAPDMGLTREQLHDAILHDLLVDFAAMFLFLLVSMTYINAMNERNVFAALRSWLARKQLSYRQLFIVTGILAFFLSAVVDNLISALLMGAVIIAVCGSQRRFVTLACVNVVVAANSGGAFSPFGDITTLMVWQSGTLRFTQFFALFLPSVVTYIVPAAIMCLFIPKGVPDAPQERATLKPGALRICFLFCITIALAVMFEHFLGLPPFLGMMTGMSLLMIFSYIVTLSDVTDSAGMDIYRHVGRAEWDTLLFFFGIIFSVGGLSQLGYLHLAADSLYGNFSDGTSNAMLGVASAIIDNIPVMFSVLRMDHEMDTFQWLLITLTVGVGGSLLSIGSAAGVGLMGIARDKYTFFSHLKWTPIIALGYAAGIATHFLIHR